MQVKYTEIRLFLLETLTFTDFFVMLCKFNKFAKMANAPMLHLIFITLHTLIMLIQNYVM